MLWFGLNGEGNMGDAVPLALREAGISSEKINIDMNIPHLVRERLVRDDVCGFVPTFWRDASIDLGKPSDGCLRSVSMFPLLANGSVVPK